MKQFMIALLVLAMNFGAAMAQEIDGKAQKANKKQNTQMHVKIIKEVNGVRTEIDTTFTTDGSEESIMWINEMEGSDIEMLKFSEDVQMMHKEKMAVFLKQHPDMDPKEAHEFVMEKHIKIICDEMGKTDHDCSEHIVIEIDSDIEHMEVITDDGNHVSIKRIVIETDDEEGGEMLRELKLKISQDGDISAEDMENMMQIHIDVEDETNGTVSVHKTLVFITRLSREDTEQLPSDKQAEFNLEEAQQLDLAYLSFYPNPNDGRFNLTFSAPETGNLRIRIIDIEGKEVYKQKLKNFSGKYDQQIDLSDRSPGIYFLSIEQNDRLVAKKIVIE